MRRSATSCLLVLALAAGVCGEGPEGKDAAAAADYGDWRPLLAAELATRSIDRPQDLYKFLHQGVLGPAHAVVDVQKARRWLAREWSQLAERDPAPTGPLLTPLRPDGRLVRLDLPGLRRILPRAERSPGGAALDTVAATFARTAATWPRETATLAALWRAATADTALWRAHFTGAELAAFEAERGTGWPAVHHSESYRRRHAPHYRVVDPGLLPPRWREAGGGP